ncbi:MAG: hypothetical protein AAF327_00555 [Cyanobacteria bacterium P01_A01_bin.37]
MSASLSFGGESFLLKGIQQYVELLQTDTMWMTADKNRDFLKSEQ